MVANNTSRWTTQSVRTRALSASGRFAGLVLPGVLSRLKSNERRIYLSFDDGPSAEMTRLVLDVLSTAKARATFFATAASAASAPELLESLRTEGHEIGNHTSQHRDFWRAPPASCFADLYASDQMLSELVGIPVPLVRPPFGHVTPSMLKWCRETGHRCVLWDIMPGEFSKSAVPGVVVHAVRSLVRPGSIVVLHDGPTKDPARQFDVISSLVGCLAADGWLMDRTISQGLRE